MCVCTVFFFGLLWFKREEEHEGGWVERYGRICVEMHREKNVTNIFCVKYCQNGNEK